MKEVTKPWITTGYQVFAMEGPQALKVERLSRMVDRNKSSFYHHFADLNVFTSHLLDHHRKMATIILEEEKACKKVDPDLFNVLIKYKTELLFHRQLLVNRHVPEFHACFEQINQEGKDVILPIWAEDLGLENRRDVARRILHLSIENLFLNAIQNDFSPDWLADFFQDLQLMVKGLETKSAT